MRRGDRADTVRGRLVVEQHICAAVHLQIDEPGGEPCAFRQDPDGDRPRQFRPRHDLRDARAMHDHGSTIVYEGTVEDMIGDNGVQCWLDHPVQATFCQCTASGPIPKFASTRSTFWCELGAATLIQ